MTTKRCTECKNKIGRRGCRNDRCKTGKLNLYSRDGRSLRSGEEKKQMIQIPQEIIDRITRSQKK